MLSTRNVGGDYYEFGLYRGYTFWYAQLIARHFNLGDMHFHGFDSFSGLPDVRGCDADMGQFQTGEFAASANVVRGYLETWGVDWSRTSLHPGFFDSLDPAADPVARAALVLVDCDLYASTVPVLRYLYPRMQDGTVIIFDDWHCFGASNEHGERRAVAEFLEEHAELSMNPLLPFSRAGYAAFTVALDGST